nr:pentapeptide repeat-containing protein [Desulfobacterales bacterium]
PGERVDHDVVKLMYRYARQRNVPFDYVELLFSGPSQLPLLFHIRFKTDEAGTVDALRRRHGEPRVIDWGAGAGQSLVWRHDDDLLVVSRVPDRLGEIGHRITFYFAANIEEMLRAEQEQREQKALEHLDFTLANRHSIVTCCECAQAAVFSHAASARANRTRASPLGRIKDIMLHLQERILSRRPMPAKRLAEITAAHRLWTDSQRRQGARAVLGGANLKEADLAKAELPGADLGDADLTASTMCLANLRDADLSGARLHRADLRDADLRRVVLSRAQAVKADLSRADLSLADLSRATLTGAVLRSAALCRAGLKGAELAGADLSGADLREANLSQTDLSGADLSYSNLTQANLSLANLVRADLKFAHLFRALLRGADLRGADLQAADLTGADLRQANLSEARLTAEQAAGAVVDATTTLPAGVKPPGR